LPRSKGTAEAVNIVWDAINAGHGDIALSRDRGEMLANDAFGEFSHGRVDQGT
jgi:hypothetical protein